MSIQIQGIEFDGPFSIEQTWKLRNQSGVYVILTKSSQSSYNAVDLGESK